LKLASYLARPASIFDKCHYLAFLCMHKVGDKFQPIPTILRKRP
jgi:hypothetical protein